MNNYLRNEITRKQRTVVLESSHRNLHYGHIVGLACNEILIENGIAWPKFSELTIRQANRHAKPEIDVSYEVNYAIMGSADIFPLVGALIIARFNIEPDHVDKMLRRIDTKSCIALYHRFPNIQDYGAFQRMLTALARQSSGGYRG